MGDNSTYRIIAPNQTLTEPINATALKSALGISDPYDTEGCPLTHYGVTARSRLEVHLQRSIVAKSYIQTETNGHSPISGTVELLPYLRSVTSIKVYDEDGTEETIDPDDCEIALGDEALLILPDDDDYYKAVITYTSGYADGQPEYEICKEAIILMVQNQYDHKADILSAEVRSMVAPLKRHHI